MLGRLLPAPFPALGRMTVAEVNIPVAVLIWLMIVPFRSGWDHEFESTSLQQGVSCEPDFLLAERSGLEGRTNVMQGAVGSIAR